MQPEIRMASPPPFAVEDRTDEDFFDKLQEEDDFGNAGSVADPATEASILRAFSSMSFADSGDAGVAAEDVDGVLHPEESHVKSMVQDEFNQQVNGLLLAQESTKNGVDGVGTRVTDGFNQQVNGLSLPQESIENDVDGVGSGSPVESTAEVGSVLPLVENGDAVDVSAEKSAGSKGTSVKAVQWSAFGGQQQSDFGAFGSDSDFLTDSADSYPNDRKADDYYASSLVDNTVNNQPEYIGQVEQQDSAQLYGFHSVIPSASSEQQDATQFYGASGKQALAGSDGQYWDNLYPGWKFDSSTGQWYQADDYATTTSAQSHGYEKKTQEYFQENMQEVGNKLILGQELEKYHVQQLETPVTEASTEVWDKNNSDQASQWNSGYPPNMVFDPQYPEWYYDMNTQQWLTLESYHQRPQQAVGTLQEPSNQDANAPNGFISKDNSSLYKGVGQYEQNSIQSHNNQNMELDWSSNGYSQQNMCQTEPINHMAAGYNCNYSQNGNFNGSIRQQNSSNIPFPLSNHDYSSSNGSTRGGKFIPTESMSFYSQPKIEKYQQGHSFHDYYGSQKSADYSQLNSQQPFQPASVNSGEGRSSAGRPPHALATFGFGGKLLVMKDTSSFSTKQDYGSMGTVTGSISILSLMEVVMDKTDTSGIMTRNSGYFQALCRQTFPGPLVGGVAAVKDVNKWIDEMISNCELPLMDNRKREQLRLLCSLLKISCHHYGKLRSPFGADPSLEGRDTPELAVTELFACAGKKGPTEYIPFTGCVQNLPSEVQTRTTAAEVQNLLISGKRKEALQHAQTGQLWGPALVLATQLGEQFYVDTVKQMAHCQFMSGSPLRTLCLLIAGQPADVFSAPNANLGSPSALNASTHSFQGRSNGMLDDWEENVAIITGNRTKGDDLVLIHLGDCLWKERGEINAAHTCYLVADANFEAYSDSARLCLIGADHWKYPRTYASPEAIQRTELYEYAKVLGNSQYILQPFQPYKLVYAYMLAEVGRVAESLRYCQTTLRLLKSSARSPEVETWKLLLSSLEERLRTHQQGGFSTNIAPGKLVGKLFTTIDKSIHRMIGGPTSTLPPMPNGSANGKESYLAAPKVVNSQSMMAMSSLTPSPSVDAMSGWPGDSNMNSMHNSISEPNFSKNPQDQLSNACSPDGQTKTSRPAGPSRIGSIGSQLLQKTIGWVSWPRSEHQAKLGETNKFYYDEKLKRWVEEGAEPPAVEAAPPPPPITSSFQNGTTGYHINGSFKTESFSANGVAEQRSAIPSTHNSDILSSSPCSNHFSARGMMGVSRYVDTFNKGQAAPIKSFQSPVVPSARPPVSAKFFIPAAPTSSDEQVADARRENAHETVANGETSGQIDKDQFASPPPTIQKIPSMDNIAYSSNTGQRTEMQNGSAPLSSRSRASSWSGSYGKMVNAKPTGSDPCRNGQAQVSPFIPTNPSNRNLNSSLPLLNGVHFGDDLHEVTL